MIEERWEDLIRRERAARLTPTRRPDPGFAMTAHQWASGVEFESLSVTGMAPGDFVRVSRQLADLLRQIRDGITEMSEEAADALRMVDRGVVAAQGVG